ncbi:MAG: biopolymer transporter ExbD [Sphingobacteriales bacterium 17-39-43]|uniref:ExbD/TolR family protein n=1 Tax=Daejeonella sp. TaxID=2805397 RepID=UPI000BCCC1CE|nr:biopolymer transporter ExbD [Daejeonella sp.]MCF8453153.1 biopolymer transporter ExbD [Pedobacter sp.]OYY02047.1 MAG: biopolymer transporter ExbD [Sphingobacteriia bacterium 35-40-5]OYZ33331.1 MAG: biopolymer transporter ExbD [Sphingobacteriales bacterium 16-39-50]OYZ57215.1 MAG: biopolymer transporter ExbD [Sphingobacteriales bacterium 24-40-4]OZA26740.1 MAG: biopolymer transporter ExbD [Sphingobacteriales bacterium 17-39-43]OZA61820.1 MAG: biopolymer transporter ExbD [Sphingobacteriales 
MNLRKRQRGNVEVHTSALNDIMFFLLLFFLLASAVANPNVVKLFLPRSSSGQSIPQKTINVSITKDLEYYVEKKQVDAANLLQSIEVYQKAAPDLTIILYADRTIAIENVIELTDIANKLKVKLVLATETKK